MERVGFCLLVAWSIFIPNMSIVYANSEVEALIAFKKNVSDPGKNLLGWDENSENPCSWSHVMCNDQKNVTRIDLGGAGLNGGLVSNLADLKCLETLGLYLNSLVGEIPVEFGNLSNMKHLDLSTNGLVGQIPDSLAKLNNLEFIKLADNTLEGPIVPGFGSLTQLKTLNLSLNNIDGTLPEWSHANVPSLKTIDLRDNKLSGSVPLSWGDIIDNADFVDLTSNPSLSGRCTVNPCGRPN